MRYFNARMLVFFTIVFIVWRIQFLLWSGYTYDEEEAKTSAIAAIFMDGPKLPVMEYIPGGYEGGILFYGIASIPFVALSDVIFGMPLVGIKVLALFTSLVLALFSILWIQKLVGFPGALATAILWLCAVPYIVQQSFIVLGNYSETIMLAGVTFYLLHTILFDKKHAWWRFALLGLFWGLGTWIHYGCLIVVGICLVTWYLADAKLMVSQRALVTVAAAVAGFSPWIVYNVNHHFLGLGRFSDGYGSLNGLAHLGHRWTWLFSEGLPGALQLIVGNQQATMRLSYAYYAVFLSLMILALVFLRKHLVSFFLSLVPWNQTPDRKKQIAVLVPFGYFFSYAFFFSMSSYSPYEAAWTTRDPEHFRHIFPLLPAMIWISGVGAGLLYSRSRIAAICSVLFLSVVGVVGQSGLLDYSEDQIWRLDDSLSRTTVYSELGMDYCKTGKDYNKVLDQLDEVEESFFLFGLGHCCAPIGSIRHNEVLEKCFVLEERRRPYCYIGVGTCLISQSQLDMASFDRLLTSVTPVARPYLVIGGAIGAIWNGEYNHPLIEQEKKFDYQTFGPEEERDTLKLFLHDALPRIEGLPPKD